MRPTAAAVRAAVISGCMGALALLLRDGAPPVEPLPPGTVLVLPSGGAAAGAGSAPAYTCPLLTLLHAQEGRDELHVDSLAVAEQLAEAGYRPAVYADVLVRAAGEEEARLLPRFDPLLGDAGLGAAGSGRFVCLAAARTPWRPATAARFPPAVQRAARAFLLAARRSASDSAPCLAALARMPAQLHEEILGRAACPLSEVAGVPWGAAAAWLAGWEACPSSGA
ncbi:histone H5 isoform X1 [Micractinium conductrix]|uniref:Histone H5 isoform X1 n=1 Tax=Micractinium conductrix TaxID=554055 RepID=A0A2P6V7U1_9CHLO|nr:histone H5 isoform X1 [Micractinium conductrix]|eukprot:PSC70148.1 histone H5 isoform X1 [Micractinium conductrix]